MLNVHVSHMGIIVLGDGSHIEGCTIENAPDIPIHIIGSEGPRFDIIDGGKPDGLVKSFQ